MLKKNLKSAISALFGALLVVALAGCNASGPDAPTRTIRQVTDGVEATSGSIKAVNVLLVTQEDGSAVLVGTIVNSGDESDSITGITANSVAGQLNVKSLEKNAPAIFAGDSANSSAIFTGLNVPASKHVDVLVTFANAEPMKIDVLVREKAEYYASVGN